MFFENVTHKAYHKMDTELSKNLLQSFKEIL